MFSETEFDLTKIKNLEIMIKMQLDKLEELRELVKDLNFIPVESVGGYTSVTYKSIDGGRMNINFNPFELDFIVIADSYGNEIIRFLV
ncbi:MAG: hypothetical protein ACTSRP_27340, partial [Candidatus Helarchaeota archaeon]